VDDATLARLRALWADLDVAPDTAYFTTAIHLERTAARTTDLELKGLLGPALAAALPGFTPFLAAFILKGGHGGDVELHPDWTYTDERMHRTYLFWCPLVDTDVDNGTLWVVPGSHHWIDGLRGSGDFPSPVEVVNDRLLADHVVSVALRAGEAIVYDAALLHGSPPNRTELPRPVAAVALAPDGAPLVHFHRPPGEALEGYAIDESWYTVQPFGERPTGYAPLAPWTDPVAPLGPDRLPSPG
jgi:hypothetical protein